jgi:hypothetical protein
MLGFLLLAHRVVGYISVLENDKDHKSGVIRPVVRLLIKTEEAFVIADCLDFDGEFFYEDLDYLREEAIRFELDKFTEAQNSYNADDFDPEDWRTCDCEICMTPVEAPNEN